MNKLRFSDFKCRDWKPMIPDQGICSFRIEFLYYGIDPLYNMRLKK